MLKHCLSFVNLIGKYFLSFLEDTGRIIIFASLSIINIFRPPFYFHNVLRQILEIGYYSLPVVGLTAVFTGAVLALQTYIGFSRFSAESAIATVVVLSVTRELGPVFAGLMVAGRVGSSIAAEIGTMRVTEQIDALITLSTNPIKYLVSPRVIASFLVLPMLVLVADIIGILGGFLVSVYTLGYNPDIYITNTFKHLETMDVVSGLIKSSVFGLIVAITGSYFGYYSNKGAQGVGAATTRAVVLADMLILLFNYFITELLF
jgi:phospholipid/cholesterol/gamma-HCH transport system permease protein